MDNMEIITLINDHCFEIKQIYNMFDKCHDTKHFDEVYHAAMIANTYSIMKDDNSITAAILLAAAYHDVGRQINEKDHNLYSQIILKNDMKLKKFMRTHMNDIYEDTIRLAGFMIYYHRRKFHKTEDSLPKMILENPGLTELCRIMYDCDKIMQSDKDRILYRYIGYYIDHMNDGKRIDNSNDFKRMINDRWKKMGKGVLEGFNPVSETFKLRVKADPTIKTGPIEFTKADIEEIYYKYFD